MHIPVMLKETIASLAIKANGIYVDGTFGGGGHCQEIIKLLGPQAKLIIIDKDLQAINQAHTLYDHDPRIHIYHGSFANMKSYCQQLGLLGKVDGILLDLGVSSQQLDTPARGFSFQHDGPLDLRMDQTHGITASQWLNNASFAELRNILQQSDEIYAKHLAKIIINARTLKPITTTIELANLISSHYPYNKSKRHPATKTFQALRIVVNNELQDLEIIIKDLAQILNLQGKLAIISFHSGEHKLIKQVFRAHYSAQHLPKRLACLKEPKIIMKLSTQKQQPSLEELTHNIRARSAYLRIAQKINEMEPVCN